MKKSGPALLFIGVVMAAFSFGVISQSGVHKMQIKRCVDEKVTLDLCSKLYGWNEQ